MYLSSMDWLVALRCLRVNMLYLVPGIFGLDNGRRTRARDYLTNAYFTSMDPVRSEDPYYPFLVTIPPIRRGIPLLTKTWRLRVI